MSISIDLSGLDKKIAEKAAAMKISLGVAMREEGGLLAHTLVKYTQPFGLKAKSQGVGEGAILRDLTEVFYILPDELCAGRTIIHDNGIYEGYVQIFAKKTGELFICPPENWHVVDGIQNLHAYWQTLRNQDGRVRRNRNKTATDGRVRIIQLWVITKSQGDALWALVSPRVGFAKAGWGTVGQKLGRNDKFPAFIQRHVGKAPGSVIDNTDKEQPSLTMINEVDYTGRVLSESAKRLAIKERKRNITANIDQYIKKAVKDK